MNNPSENENNLEESQKSKSEIKREFKSFQELGRQLVELPPKQLAVIPLSEGMLELIVAAQSLNRGTLNRQLRLIGRRMPEEDVESITTALEKLRLPQKQATEKLHELEQLRDKLLHGDQAVFEELTTKYANLDRQYVNQLIRNAKKELDNNKPPKSSRLLFKYLSELKNSD